MPSTAGAKAFKKKGEAFAAENRKRRAATARQKAAREALAYPDAPKGLTPEALLEQHRQMKASFLEREAQRRAAA